MRSVACAYQVMQFYILINHANDNSGVPSNIPYRNISSFQTLKLYASEELAGFARSRILQDTVDYYFWNNDNIVHFYTIINNSNGLSISLFRYYHPLRR